MIKIENVSIYGWEEAIRGMRNPMNSWDRSDSNWKYLFEEGVVDCIGDDDHDLMMRLAGAGKPHSKYRRMITVYLDIVAPLYWWKEFDTYKVGTVANSCSTMHKIHDKEFTLEDFSCEHLEPHCLRHLEATIELLNTNREAYKWCNTDAKKDWWWQMIQLLPSSYNQRRTVMLNYEVLNAIYYYRKYHKQDEWREFCQWIETLPYSELITCNGCEEDHK